MIRIAMFCMSIAMISCSDYDYYQAVQTELEKGIRNDSLFLGYHFNMSNEEFFDYTWQLNKQHLVKQGPYNQSVEYLYTKSKDEIQMNYFPEFRDDKIYQMHMICIYTSWAPWAKEYWSDKLILELSKILEEWHNVRFNLFKDENGTPAFVTANGNRRILLTVEGDQKVRILYTDMSAMVNPLQKLIVNKKYE